MQILTCVCSLEGENLVKLAWQAGTLFMERCSTKDLQMCWQWAIGLRQELQVGIQEEVLHPHSEACVKNFDQIIPAHHHREPPIAYSLPQYLINSQHCRFSALSCLYPFLGWSNQAYFWVFMIPTMIWQKQTAIFGHHTFEPLSDSIL